MIRGLGRCLQYRNGLSERSVRNHWSTPSSSETTASPARKSAEEPQDVDFATNFKNLLPSQQFRSLLSDTQTKRLELLIKQVELYCYMARKVPSHLSDECWQDLLRGRTVLERVCKLEFYAVKQRREEKEMTADPKDNGYSEYLVKQKEMYDAGGMGYGPDMYEMISNPMRRKSRVHLVEGGNVWSTLRLAEAPTVVMDMQYIFDGKHRGEYNIKRQLQYTITENMHTRRPLPLQFANVANNAFGREYMEKWLGYWSGIYTHQTILPDFGHVGPRETVVKSTGIKKPNIVYISRFAKKILDGPLTADAYVLCASYDHNRESIIAAHKDKIEAYRLPIQRYVKWEAGPQVIPFPNLMRIFRELIDTGGDWRTALYNNISKRHITPPSSEAAAIRQNQRKNMERERDDVISAIIDSYGEV